MSNNPIRGVVSGDGIRAQMSGQLTLLRRDSGGLAPWPGLGSSLAALYLFDDGAGTTLTDYSGNDLHGTLGAAGAAPTWATEGLSFDGGDHVSLPGGGALDLSGNNAALAVVCNLSADANPGQIIGAHGPNPFPGYTVESRNGVFYIYTNGGGSDASGSGDRRNTWSAFIAILTAGTLTFYLNGNSIGSPVAGNSITEYTGAKSIGSNAVKSGAWCTGKICFAAVWDAAISSDDAATVYSNLQIIMAGRGVTLPDPT